MRSLNAVNFSIITALQAGTGETAWKEKAKSDRQDKGCAGKEFYLLKKW